MHKATADKGEENIPEPTFRLFSREKKFFLFPPIPPALSKVDPFAVTGGTAADGEAGFMGVDSGCNVVFGVAVFFQTGNEVIHNLREGVSVDIAGFFDAGIYLEELFLLFEAAQIELVVEDGAVFADDMGVGGVGHKSGK